MWDKFVHVIRDCVRAHVPLYKNNMHKKKSKWMSTETKRLLRKRNKAWSAYLKSRCTKLYKTYKMERNEVVTSIGKDKTQYQKKLVKHMKCNRKMFYSIVMFEASNKRCFCQQSS